ncbi:MAG: CinA family protein [Lachnospiraceae bacterium]|nr:CinA family protein [Lachnospiraceae bacterium]
MNEYKLAKKCVRKLKRRQKSVSTAESLTGGMIASLIVSVSGASKVFEEGYVTYSDFAKIKNLLVDPDTIDTFGVASALVASEMAKGALYESGSDYAIATTGVAGPKKDQYGTKVGTVYIACASKKHVVIRKYHFWGNRNKKRRKTSIAALKLLLHMIKKGL